MKEVDATGEVRKESENTKETARMSLRAPRSNLNHSALRLLRRWAPRNDILEFVLSEGLAGCVTENPLGGLPFGATGKAT